MLGSCSATRNAEMVAVHEANALAHETLLRALAAAVAYTSARLAGPPGFTGFRRTYLSRDFSAPYQASKQVAGAWLGPCTTTLIRAWTCTSRPSGLVTSTPNFQLCAAIPEKPSSASFGTSRHRRQPAGGFLISPRALGAQFLSRSCGRSGPRCDCRRRRWSRARRAGARAGASAPGDTRTGSARHSHIGSGSRTCVHLPSRKCPPTARTAIT